MFSNCTNYDLCAHCEGKLGIHHPDHVFVKLHRPCFNAGIRDGRKVPLLRRMLYNDGTEHRHRDTDARADR